MLELLVLNRFAEIILKHAPKLTTGSADYDITKANVVSLARDTPSDTDHKADSDILEGTQHVCSGGRRRSGTIVTIRHNSDNDIVAAHLAQCVVVGVIWRHKLGPPMFFVQKLLCSNVFHRQGTDPTHGIACRVCHT